MLCLHPHDSPAGAVNPMQCCGQDFVGKRVEAVMLEAANQHIDPTSSLLETSSLIPVINDANAVSILIMDVTAPLLSLLGYASSLLWGTISQAIAITSIHCRNRS